MRPTTVRRLVPTVLSALAVATFTVTAASGADAAPRAVRAASEFCAQAELVFDGSLLTAGASDLKAARKKLDSILDAKPPRKVKKAIKRINKLIAEAGGDASAKSVAALTGAAAVVTSYVARECGGSGRAGTTGSGGSSRSSARCPLAVEDVSAALGETVEAAPGACQFFPPDGASPRALYVGQVALMCQGSTPAELGYTETIDGLGEKAYVQSGTSSARILVCGDAPFEVSVEIIGDPTAPLAAARALAEKVVDS